MLRRFLRNEDGATAIEYGLIAAIVCIGIIAGLTNLRTSLSGRYENVAATVGNS